MDEEEKNFDFGTWVKIAQMSLSSLSKHGTSAAANDSDEETETEAVDLTGRRVGAPKYPPTTFTRILLENVDNNLFLARKEHLWKPAASKVIYGGQVIGQALAAAIKTAPPDKVLHSMHCYFLIGGRTDSNLVYTVLPVRDGNSFCTRLVLAQQRGRPIFILTASFQKPEVSSLCHQSAMPNVPQPEDLLRQEEYYDFMKRADSRVGKAMRLYLEEYVQRVKLNPIDVKIVQTGDLLHSFGKFNPSEYEKMDPEMFKKIPVIDQVGRKMIVWIRVRHSLLQDDMDSHRAVFAYASDMYLLGAAIGGDVGRLDVGMMASLDHSMWFHSDFRMDEWLLYECESHRSGNGRGLSTGKLYKRDGTLAVSCSQEGVIRLSKDVKKFKNMKPSKL